MPNRSQNSRSRQKISNAPSCCCRCNGINARCKFCACVKAGRACTCCLPARNGLCSNVTAHIPVSNVSQSTLTISSQPIPRTTTLSSDSQQLSLSQPILRQLHVFSSPVPSSCSPTPLQTPMPSFHSPSSSHLCHQSSSRPQGLVASAMVLTPDARHAFALVLGDYSVLPANYKHLIGSGRQ